MDDQDLERMLAHLVEQADSTAQMVRYLYAREQRREYRNTVLFWSVLIFVVIVGGTLANVYMYKHGWK